MRLVIIFDHFGPYHLARFRATRQQGQNLNIEVIGLEIVETSSEYAWVTLSNEIRKDIFTLFSHNNHCKRKLRPHHKFVRVWQALNALSADALVIPGYRGAVSLAAFLWGKTKKKPMIMMSESTQDDKTRATFREWCKSQIVRRYDAALVGGKRQQEYAMFLGIPRQRVFLGYDVVDNAYFAQVADKIRLEEPYYRQALGLPNSFFLTVNRFIAKKNLSGLIEAYADYRRLTGKQAWDLVICGSGPLEETLKKQAQDIAGIHFPGFMQVDKLPLYYGLASTFITPSSHFEQWGLVVNEAMASGLPVLVSRVCGCAPDLVREGVNGFTFDPFDLDGLARLMLKMSSGEVNLEGMGQASQKIIAHFTPEIFAENLFRAFAALRAV